MEEFLDFFDIVGPYAGIFLGAYIVLNLIGELCELKGKIVPEFMKIRKFFKRKKDEKKKQKQLLEDVRKSLNEINAHYSEDNITKRNEWMKWVNDRAVIYDKAVEDLVALQKTLLDNNALTLDLYINVNRHRILDFASKVANDNLLISQEEFNRIFKVYKEYHNILEQHNMENGEVDIAYKVIVEAYKERLTEHTFLEDLRGYEKK